MPPRSAKRHTSPMRLRQSVDELLSYTGLSPVDWNNSADDWETIRSGLASRNLGLVRIANPDAFTWPGYWLAIIHADEEFLAAVMYGSPSAVISPEGVRGAVEEGYVLAPFDPALDVDDPYLTTGRQPSGNVTGLFIAGEKSAPMQSCDWVRAVAGVGLEGDRYAAGEGTFSGPVGYEVTLIDEKSLAVVEPSLAAEETRRNIVTSGVDLNRLVGRRFQVGEATLIGRRLCEPCRHLQDLLGRSVIRPLVHKAGLRADILKGGIIQVGSNIVS